MKDYGVRAPREAPDALYNLRVPRKAFVTLFIQDARREASAAL